MNLSNLDSTPSFLVNDLVLAKTLANAYLTKVYAID